MIADLEDWLAAIVNDRDDQRFGVMHVAPAHLRLARHAGLRDQMRDAGLDALLVTSLSERRVSERPVRIGGRRRDHAAIASR